MKTRYSNSLTEAYRTIVEGENGLWDNIHNKRKRGEKMRKKGDKGAPTDDAIKKSQEETDAEKLHQDSYEIGTDEYRKHTQDVTPGQVTEEESCQCDCGKQICETCGKEHTMDEHKGDKPHKHPHVDETAKHISSRFGKKTEKKEEVEKAFQSLTLVENYRVLATKGMGAETPKTGKYGQEVDYYEPQHGNKHQGKITKASGFSYTVQDDKTGKKYNFKWYDPKKAKKLMQTESAASDARRAMMKDPDMKQRAFDKDITATDDDQKAASKNIMMQLRKAVSLKGRFAVEFGDGKKIKIPPKIAQEVQRKFNAIRRPQEKQKFQAKVAQSHKSMLAALRESYDTSPQKIIDEAILKDRDYEVDEKEGVVKISKKNFAKVRKDAKGTDKSKPTMMVLTKKGTSLYPVKFTEEVDLDEKKQPVFKGTPAQIKKQMKDWKKKNDKVKIGEDDDPCWDNYKQVGMKDKGGKEVPNCVPEEVQLAEGKMKELHGYIQQGKSAEQIAKIMKLDVKTIKSLMASYSVSEGDAEDRVRDKQKDQSMRDRDTKEKEIEKAKVQDFRSAQRDKKNERERNQRNEVLDRIDSKLKERKNG